MTLSLTLGVAALVGAPGVAIADAGSGNGPGGDGDLHLIPEVIVNSSMSAGGSTDFPFMSRLFLPEVAGRAEELASARSTVTEAVERLTFTSFESPARGDLYAEARSRLFDGYSPRAIIDAETRASTSNTDIWLIAVAVAAIPAAVLAGFLGLKVARRRIKRHA